MDCFDALCTPDDAPDDAPASPSSALAAGLMSPIHSFTARPICFDANTGFNGLSTS
jgi:hypothetical protein